MKADVKVYRDNYVESSHSVHVAVVDRVGKLLAHYGDPERLTFARSAMKPFQTIPVVETGAADAYHFQPEQVALCCASHSGERLQRSRVLKMLERIGLAEDDLQCGTHIPRDDESYQALIRAGGVLTPVFSNCSGKHAGMLATAAYMNEDVATYRDLNHPVQQRILRTIADMCQYPRDKIETAIDGCGVPVHRLPLHKIASGFARLAAPETMDDAERGAAICGITEAMTAHPEMVAGKDRLDTDLMRTYQGRLFSKAGAEAVQCVGDREQGIGIAIKVEDGGARALHAATMSALRQLGIGAKLHFAQLDRYVHPIIENMHGEVVGRIEATFTL